VLLVIQFLNSKKYCSGWSYGWFEREAEWKIQWNRQFL